MPIENDFYFELPQEFNLDAEIEDIAIDYEIPNEIVLDTFTQFLKSNDTLEALEKTREEIAQYANSVYDGTKKGDDTKSNLQVCDICAITTLLNIRRGKPIMVSNETWKEKVSFSNPSEAAKITWEDIVILSAIYTVLNKRLARNNVVDTHTIVELNADKVYHVLLPDVELPSEKTRNCYLTRDEFLQKANNTIAKFKKLSGSYQTFSRKGINEDWKPIEDIEIDEDFYFNTMGFVNGKGLFKASQCQRLAIFGKRMKKKVSRLFLAKGKQTHNAWLDMLAKTYIVFQHITKTRNKCIDIKEMGIDIGFRLDFNGSSNSKVRVRRILNELNEAKGKNGKSYNWGFKLVGMTITWE